MATYALDMDDDGGSDEQLVIEADHTADAVQEAESECEAWARDGDWGHDGAVVIVSYTLKDELGLTVAHGRCVVEIEPDHEYLIRHADGSPQRESCGDAPDDHDWTGDGEGGCAENPGVWSTGGTVIVVAEHCRRCGLHRTARSTGPQRNPDEHDTVEYMWLNEAEVAAHVRGGTMDDDA